MTSARTRHHTSALDTLPGFYSEWERWAADITESHATYLPLVWFRSPSYEASWGTVPALWSGPRRHPVDPMPPLRPRPGVPFPWLPGEAQLAPTPKPGKCSDQAGRAFSGGPAVYAAAALDGSLSK